MKKLLTAIAFAGVLVACNNNSEGTTGADTTMSTVDTATLTPDTTVVPVGTDTSGATSDTSAAQ